LLNFHLAGLDEYFPLRRDGTFGSKTYAALTKFQSLNLLWMDGIAGRYTRAALLAARYVSAQSFSMADYESSPRERGPAPLLSILSAARGRIARDWRLAATIGAASMPGLLAVGDTPPPSVDARSAVVQAGQQVQFLPLVHLAHCCQRPVEHRDPQFRQAAFHHFAGRPVLSESVQVPSGGWTGQGFVQMGPSESFKRGSFDLLNPFVQLFLQRNDGQPFSAGFSVGNQANWNIIQDQLSVFLNIQTAFGVGLNNGQGIPPPIQTYGGVQIDIFKILFH
jgi:hypothetical protein